MTARQGTTRAEHRDRTREDIRRAALDLFEDDGFARTTIDEIVAAAGVGRRTFFRYFPSKEAVLFSGGVFEHLIADLDDALAAGSPPVQALIEAIARDGYGSEEPDETTIRRRRLRSSLLREEPSLLLYYQRAFSQLAQHVADTVRRHPEHAAVHFLPEALGGLLYTVAMEHLNSGETHHFRIDADAWRTAVRALEQSFPAAPPSSG